MYSRGCKTWRRKSWYKWKLDWGTFVKRERIQLSKSGYWPRDVLPIADTWQKTHVVQLSQVWIKFAKTGVSVKKGWRLHQVFLYCSYKTKTKTTRYYKMDKVDIPDCWISSSNHCKKYCAINLIWMHKFVNKMTLAYNRHIGHPRLKWAYKVHLLMFIFITLVKLRRNTCVTKS